MGKRIFVMAAITLLVVGGARAVCAQAFDVTISVTAALTPEGISPKDSTLQGRVNIRLEGVNLTSLTVFSLPDFNFLNQALIASTRIQDYFLTSKTIFTLRDPIQEKVTVSTKLGVFDLLSEALFSITLRERRIGFTSEIITITAPTQGNPTLSSATTLNPQGFRKEVLSMELSVAGLSLSYAVQFSANGFAKEILNLSFAIQGTTISHTLSYSPEGFSLETLTASTAINQAQIANMSANTLSKQRSTPGNQRNFTQDKSQPPNNLQDKLFIEAVYPLLGPIDVNFGKVEVGDLRHAEIKIPRICHYEGNCWIEAILHNPSPPFYFKSVYPPVGSMIPWGGSITIYIDFIPTTWGTFSDSFALLYCFRRPLPPPPPEGSNTPLQEAMCDVIDIRLRGIAMHPPHAVCNFSPQRPTTATDVQFSSEGSYDPDGWITRYEWDFDDGSHSDLANPSHRYTNEGTYNVSLTVWDNDGLSDTDRCLLHVKRHIEWDRLATTAGVGLAAGFLTHYVLSQPPSLPPPAPGFASAILPAAVVTLAGLYAFPADQLILGLPEGVNQKEAQRLISQIVPESEIIGFFSPLNAYLVRFKKIDQIAKTEDKIKELNEIQTELERRLPEGSWVLKNYLGELEGTPNTDIANLQPDLRMAYDTVHAQEAWEYLSQSGVKPKPVRIAIIDTGIDGDHREFKGINLWGRSYLERSDGTKEPWQEDHAGYYGHGTCVSGIIGAENGQGQDPLNNRMNGLISGITKNYEIQIYKVARDLFSVWDSVRLAVSRAIEDLEPIQTPAKKVIRGRAVVVNLSIGWSLPPESNEKQRSDFEKIYESFERIMKSHPNVLFVTSAGNGDHKNLETSKGLKLGKEKEERRHAPGGINVPNNITVAATDQKGITLTSWSNYGPAVDIAAPGVGVYTTRNDGSYVRMNGTSFSAALVSGAAAMLLSIEPHLSPAEVKTILKETTSMQISKGGSGVGLLDIRKAAEEVLKRNKVKSKERILLASLVGAAVVLAGILIVKPF